MHLSTALVFMVLFLHAEQPGRWAVVSSDDVLVSLLAAVLQPLGIGLGAVWVARRTRVLLARHRGAAHLAQHFQHRATSVLRASAVLGLAGLVLLTRWPEWFAFRRVTPALQILGDLIVLLPFFASVATVWLATYSQERALRVEGARPLASLATSDRPGRLGAYLAFNVRHQVLTVAVPMTVILFAANMTRGHERVLRGWTGFVWAPDVLLGLVAVSVFIVAPWMLCHIWRTVPLEPGPMRDRLETIGGRIGLRFRDLLVWHSDGTMINAAVMGVLAPMRYVLLSDGLLQAMDERQIEAVFGHEAGHVRHRHIQHFLLFAFVGWVVVAGLMELLARITIAPGSTVRLSSMAIQGVGILAAAVLWGTGFGWLSRRFEREADLFGARCVTPSAEDCRLPCAVHGEDQRTPVGPGRVCATGAAIFTSALDRVAVLNGIPHEERSWRHSSIGSRIRFLTSLAGDPRRAARFERLLKRIKTAVLTAAVVGATITVYYWIVVPEPAILRMQAARL